MNIIDHSKENMIGKGTYGEAYRIVGPLGEDLCKKTSKNIQSDKHIPVVPIREICLLSEPKYRHIIHAKNVTLEQLYPNIFTLNFHYDYGAIDVYKLCNYFINKQRTLEHITAKSILFQLLLALNHLHSHGIIHCDISPANLIIMPRNYERPGILKLIDFGLSRTDEWKGQDKSTIVVTIWYRSPELLLDDKKYTVAVDIWAAGCIFAELLTGQVIFHSETRSQNSNEFCSKQMIAILSIMGNFKATDLPPYATTYMAEFNNLNRTHFESQFEKKFAYIDKDARDLLREMLCINPNNRISAYNALRHPYFSKDPVPIMNITSLFSDSEWADLESNASRKR
ncbi:CMGC family protein kinase [Trichomonas vaginalis G3]|uniref:CMGC family protein kinase n=1 Tax=Trichomonas vaginalis (strain ATCC PRA-98 / G3) TaxID=412133 RepID=A2E0V0_TRIV3|nr:RNA polymerase II CTD heptapeptide repeat kinase protein [Trichomonas vaginalis G3]EAY13705.1 CMGC family protein kinase [Trichomonas vaginalis G3]KAI5529638.1 RNA polymerase II CTD heptapeptide repeat kinase protein [Trichomonas vaginalis G3]|eukprot:XP_001325928.1 CMGC family protein kinase [Trichomonas vaginalis G3]